MIVQWRNWPLHRVMAQNPFRFPQRQRAVMHGLVLDFDPGKIYACSCISPVLFV
jgi:hypothetical protein